MNLTPCEEIASLVNIDERCGCCSRFVPHLMTLIFLTMDWHDKKVLLKHCSRGTCHPHTQKYFRQQFFWRLWEEMNPAPQEEVATAVIIDEGCSYWVGLWKRSLACSASTTKYIMCFHTKTYIASLIFSHTIITIVTPLPGHIHI